MLPEPVFFENPKMLGSRNFPASRLFSKRLSENKYFASE
jgi:hypothetical protein